MSIVLGVHSPAILAHWLQMDTGHRGKPGGGHWSRDWLLLKSPVQAEEWKDRVKSKYFRLLGPREFSGGVA